MYERLCNLLIQRKMGVVKTKKNIFNSNVQKCPKAFF